MSGPVDFAVSFLAPVNHLFKLHQVSRELAYRVYKACFRMIVNGRYRKAIPRSYSRPTDGHFWDGECSDRARLELLVDFIIECKPLHDQWMIRDQPAYNDAALTAQIP